MRTWDDSKNHVSTVEYEIAKDIKESEEIVAIVSAMIEQSNASGLTQRNLAAMCGIKEKIMFFLDSIPNNL